MRLVALVLCLTLMGCGSDTESESADEDKETVFDPLVQNIDKAKAVEDTVMEQKAAMDQALRDAEDGVDESEEESDD